VPAIKNVQFKAGARCSDFKNIFRRKIRQKFGVFDSKQS
jgi:hypothetical protein